MASGVDSGRVRTTAGGGVAQDGGHTLNNRPLDWITSTTLNTSTIFEFQTSDISRVLTFHIGSS